MCGVLGWLSRTDLTDHFKNALDDISHRGPDNLGFVKLGDVLLGHVRLSIIDPSELSNQPLWDSAHKACIVFNGEIYNYKELRAEMIAQGVIFKTEGDAEVILNLYLIGGEGWLARLNGIFSFSIYDSRDQQLFIARDAFGVKPLYYFEDDDGFFFSSEIKGLLRVPSLSRALNYNAIFRTLVFLWSPGPDTVFSNIKKLEPGTYLRVQDKKIVERGCFWEWPEYSPIERAVADIEAELIGSLESSVRQQLVADVPIGSFLSGGLDSSLVVALAKKVGAKNMQCFTIDAAGGGNNDGFFDDLPYAREAASYLDLDLHVVKVAPDIVKLLPKIIYHLDEPQADPAVLNISLICELARKMGIKVLLSGAGGDDIFTGYRRHRAVSFEKYWSGFPLGVRSGIEKFARSLPKRSPMLRRIAKAFSYAGCEQDERILSYFYWIDPVIVRGLFTDEVSALLDVNPMEHMVSELKTRRSLPSEEKMLHLERKYFLVDHNFNYTDKMSMAHGVEVRVPFLDYQVVRVASTTPSDLKQKRGVGKWILKKAAEKYLPHSIIYRSKSGFGAPLRSWLNNELRSTVDDLLSEESVNRRAIFKYSSVQELINKDRRGAEDYSYPIFALLTIEIWCRIFLDGEPEGRVI